MMIFSVLLLGMLGVGLRLAADTLINVPFYPLGTFLVNIAGCFLAGWIFTSPTLSPLMRSSLLVGLCGGLTTFSSFIIQCLQFMKEGMFVKALTYLLVSVLLGFFAALAGMRLSEIH
jgi:CrcB protein